MVRRVTVAESPGKKMQSAPKKTEKANYSKEEKIAKPLPGKSHKKTSKEKPVKLNKQDKNLEKDKEGKRQKKKLIEGESKAKRRNYREFIRTKEKGNNELVFINFYADWCRFSNMLAPTWDEAAERIKSLFPEEGKVVFGKVDCDAENKLASRFHITKYPTLKLLRNGQAAKREYRGQRSVDAITNFISEQLRDSIKKISDLTELQEIEGSKKRTVIGYFEKDDHEYEIFQKISKNLKEDCVFYADFGDTVRAMHPKGQNIVAFRSTVMQEDDIFRGDLSNYDEMSIWATERCIPLVREITFENAEELTEEGLPFLILFHNGDDVKSVQRYTKVIMSELLDQKQSVNFLTADGQQFAHPLHHLGKSNKDLPLIAIDSFRHMYLFPDFNELETPGKLKTLLLDLYSGKLHREFHYGPDQETEPSLQVDIKSEGLEESTPPQPKKPTSPPESTFKKLAPSKNRYTLLKDEL